MKKRVMSIILCVVILVTSGISCFAASVSETSDTPNGNTIKFLKSEEGYDYGNTAYIIRDKETKQIIPLSVGPLDGYSYAYLPENSDFTVEKVEKYTTPFNDLGEKYKYDSYINEITAREVVVGFEEECERNSLIATDWVWSGVDKIKEPIECEAKVRSSQQPFPVSVIPISDNEYEVSFCVKQKAIAPGQSVVLYKDNIVLGGGIINK